MCSNTISGQNKNFVKIRVVQKWGKLTLESESPAPGVVVRSRTTDSFAYHRRDPFPDKDLVSMPRDYSLMTTKTMSSEYENLQIIGSSLLV